MEPQGLFVTVQEGQQMQRRVWLALLALAGIVGSQQECRAGLLPVNVSVNPDGGNYRWTYAIVLPSDVQIRQGDFFTIYDFAGYLPGGESSPSSWSFTSNTTGPAPVGVAPVDNPGVPNLTWTYNGETEVGATGLGNFWAFSEFKDKTLSNFSASAHSAINGQPNSNITKTDAPVFVPAPPVPEPATLVLAGLGLPLVGLWRVRRRRAV
jgi:hypothetical protein